MTPDGHPSGVCCRRVPTAVPRSGAGSPLAARVAFSAPGTVERLFTWSGLDTQPDTTEQTKVGSEPGALIAWNCGILVNLAVTLRNGTGCEFVFRDPGVHQATDANDRATFDKSLGGVSFGS